MLVVAEQAPFRVARQRRLASSRQPEEQRRIAGRADVGGAVHREDALKRQQVVQDRKNRLLDLPRVACSADQHQLSGETDEDEHVRARSVTRRVGLEARGVYDRELRDMLGALLRIVFREKHVAGEQVVPRELVDDANG
jgi:hypothetical protein